MHADSICCGKKSFKICSWVNHVDVRCTYRSVGVMVKGCVPRNECGGYGTEFMWN